MARLREENEELRSNLRSLEKAALIVVQCRRRGQQPEEFFYEAPDTIGDDEVWWLCVRAPGEEAGPPLGAE